MAKREKAPKYSVKKYTFFGILFLLVGGVAALVAAFKPDLLPEALVGLCLWGGVVLAGLAVLFLLAALADKRRMKKDLAQQGYDEPAAGKHGKKNAPYQQPQGGYNQGYGYNQQGYGYNQGYGKQGYNPRNNVAPDPRRVQPAPANNKKSKVKAHRAAPRDEVKTVHATLEGNGNVRYIPSDRANDFIEMGARQSTEEKFNEIAKMDQTQFVIYIAKLFSRKGFQVKFTPVLENYSIDLIVENMGEAIAVGCLLSSKVLCADDVNAVFEGSKYYQVNKVMALTNMYFDRTALNLAKQEKITLVDRNILAEDFMR